ncbi:MAG TPA: hypothetical protein VK859_11455, partial [bacterium]|nr:hypothetical protein [bacterium]
MPAASRAQSTLLINYPETAGGGDNIVDGLNITSFPGSSLSSVVLWISDNVAENASFQLQAYDKCFPTDGGTLVGTATSAVETMSGNNNANLPVTFTFGGNPAITPGDGVGFELTKITGTGGCFFSLTGNFGGLTGAEIGVNDLSNDTCVGAPRVYGYACLVYGNPAPTSPCYAGGSLGYSP